MIRLLFNISSPIFSLSLFVISSAFFTTYISIFSRLSGFSQTSIGYFHSAFYFGYLVGSAKVEVLIRRVGHIRAFSTFSSVNIVVILLLGILPVNPGFLIVARFINGLCMASLFIVVESWMLSKSDSKNRGQVLGIYMVALYASQSGSQMIMKYVTIMSATPFLIAAAFAALAIFPLSITKSVSPELEKPTLTNVFKVLKISALGSMSCFLSGCMLSSFYSFTPNFAQDYGLSISSIMSITIAGGFLLQWPIGKMSDIFDRKKVVSMVALLAIIPCMVIFFLSTKDNIVMYSSFILGGLIFAVYPLGISQVCDHVETKNIHSALGLLSLIYGIGATAGPILAPFIINLIGLKGLYLYLALVSLVLFLFSLYFRSSRPAIAMEDQNDYVSVLPKMTMVGTRLDPRSNDDNILASEEGGE